MEAVIAGTALALSFLLLIAAYFLFSNRIPQNDRQSSSPTTPTVASGSFNSDLEASLKTLGNVANPEANYISFGGVSVLGKTHQVKNFPRQDSYTHFRIHEWVVMAIADGVSSATHAEMASNFVTQHLERQVRVNFPEGIDFEVSSWNEIARNLTKGLVKLYDARFGGEVGSDNSKSHEIRTRVSRKIATTLEILAFNTNSRETGTIEYALIRLAGDGSAYLFSTNEQSRVTVFSVNSKANNSSEVSALPITDQTPLIERGFLSMGQAIILATDGIGDHLGNEPKWLSDFGETLLSDELDIESMVKLTGDQHSNSMDDKSFVWVKLK